MVRLGIDRVPCFMKLAWPVIGKAAYGRAGVLVRFGAGRATVFFFATALHSFPLIGWTLALSFVC